MTNLNMDSFNPKVAELHDMATKYRGIVIKGIDDKEGYQNANEARKELKKTRVAITKQGKELRDEANQFAKMVIAKEKELVSIIEPIEENLEQQIAEFDRLVEIEKRKKLIPERRQILEQQLWAEYNPEHIADEQLAEMEESTFTAYIIGKKQEIMDRKEREIAERERKIKEAEEAEANKQKEEERQKELEQARKEAAEKAAKETEERMKREQEEKELRERREKEAQEKKEADEKLALEKKKKYVEYRASLGYTEETKHLFKEDRNGDTITIYKVVGTFTI